MSTFISLMFSGLSAASIAALAALGFVLVYRTTGVVNFAQGDLITMAAFVAVYLTADADLGLPWYIGYPLTLAIMFAIGVVLDQVASAALRGKNEFIAVIATLGAAIIIRTLLAILFGSDARRLVSPLRGDVFDLGGAKIPYLRVTLILGAAVALVLTHLFLMKTHVGRQMRAMAADRETARLYAVPLRFRSALAWGLSGVIAGLTALLAAPLSSVDATFGFSMMLAGFAAAVLGGFGGVLGIVVGALCIGLAEQVFGAYVFREFRDAYPFILMIVVIAVRPAGLLRTDAGSRL